MGLVLQSSERCRVNQSVAVTLEFRAIVVSKGVTLFLSETLVGYELLPVHCGSCWVLGVEYWVMGVECWVLMNSVYYLLGDEYWVMGVEYWVLMISVYDLLGA